MTTLHVIQVVLASLCSGMAGCLVVQFVQQPDRGSAGLFSLAAAAAAILWGMLP